MDHKKKNLYDAILARLEEKSDHEYMWPRWAAADEAAGAVLPILEGAWEEGYAEGHTEGYGEGYNDGYEYASDES